MPDTVPSPGNIRLPFAYVAYDSTGAFQGPSVLQYKALLIGQRLAGGSAPALRLDRVSSVEQAEGLYGQGSQLAIMTKAWRDNNTVTDLYCISLEDDPSGIAATGSITIGGTVTATGTIYLYVGSTKVTVIVNAGDSPTQVGDKIVTAITAGLPITASNSAGTVTFTAKNKGEAGNDLTLDLNYGDNEALPLGITASLTPFVGGANNPDISLVISKLGDSWYQVMVAAYYDATNLTAIETELASRFSAARMIDGVYVTSRRGSLGALETFGNGRNSAHVNCPHSEQLLTSSVEFATGWAAYEAKAAQNDPAKPFQSGRIIGPLAPRELDRFTNEENNSLLYDGIATWKVNASGEVRIARSISMYQTNELDAPDIAYLDINTLTTLMYLRYDFRTQMATKYPQAKLADDGAPTIPGQVIMTPKLGKTAAIKIFKNWQKLGLVENLDQYINDLQCIRPDGDPNRLDFYLSPDLMNQLRIIGAVMRFLLNSVTA